LPETVWMDKVLEICPPHSHSGNQKKVYQYLVTICCVI